METSNFKDSYCTSSRRDQSQFYFLADWLKLYHIMIVLDLRWGRKQGKMHFNMTWTLYIWTRWYPKITSTGWTIKGQRAHFCCQGCNRSWSGWYWVGWLFCWTEHRQQCSLSEGFVTSRGDSAKWSCSSSDG